MKKRYILFAMATAIMLVAATTAHAQGSAHLNAPAGVGISTPAATLHIHNATALDPVQPFDPNPRDQIFDHDYQTILRFTNPNSGTTSTDGFTITQENYHVLMRNYEKGHIHLKTLGGNVYLSETGLFGIGDTAVGYSFNVQGASRLYGNTDVIGAFTASGNTSLGGTLAVGNNFSVLSNGNVYATSLSLGGGLFANSSGTLQVGNDIAVGLTHISSTLGFYRANSFNLSNDGNLTLAGALTAGGNIVGSGTIRVGNGFFCDAQGNMKVKELRVTLTDWPDFVFGDGYRLAPLTEVEDYISENGHLPQMPSAAEVEENGADLGEMNRLLLQKVEELTLYVIDLQKQIEELKSNK